MAQRILVFENDEDFAREIKNGFEKAGAIVDLVDDGPTGLEHAAESIPDLILLSIELPGMNGFLVCKKIKKSAGLKDVPLIILSSEASAETFEQHSRLRTRAQKYIHKPVSFSQLFETVKELLKFDKDKKEEGRDDFDDVLDVEDEIILVQDDVGSDSGNPQEETTYLVDDADQFANDAFDSLMTDSKRAPSEKSEKRESKKPSETRNEALYLHETESRPRRDSELHPGRGQQSAVDRSESKKGVGFGRDRELLDLKEQLNRKDRELLGLMDQLSSRDKQLIDARDENLKIARDLADLKDHNLELETKTKDLELALDNSEQDAIEKLGQADIDHKRALETARQTHERNAASLQNEIETLRTMVQRTEEEKARLEESLGEVADDRDSKSEELSNTQSKVDKLEAETAELLRRVESLAASLDRAKKKIESDEELLKRVRKAMAIGIGLLEEQRQNQVES
jgi:CheY-like chemotaxis protein